MLHRMDVEQKIGGVDYPAQGSVAGELDRLARSIKSCSGPQSVEILVDETRGGGYPAIEAAICGDVVERQGQPSTSGTQFGAKQAIERNGTADLVAVGQ